uniref:Uncharacterized protein n=1 Tax=Meleagris gallopavo TaxID=9103 RepID=A0A803YSL4_MELGA
MYWESYWDILGLGSYWCHTGIILVPYWRHTGSTGWSTQIYTGLYWSILIYINPYWCHTGAILVYTGLYWSLYWFILVRTGPHCSTLVYIAPYWSLLVYTGPSHSILVHTGPYWSILVYTGFHSRGDLGLERNGAVTLRCPVLLVVGDNSPHEDAVVECNAMLDPTQTSFLKMADGGGQPQLRQVRGGVA